MIPGFDVVSVGEVEEHALAVPHPLARPAPTFPLFVRVSGNSYLAFKLSKCYSWGYAVSFFVEVKS